MNSFKHKMIQSRGWLIFLDDLYRFFFDMKFDGLKLRLLCLGFILVIASSSTEAYGQNCPSFEIKELKNVVGGLDNGRATIKIISSKIYSERNFEVRQKKNKVTGQLGFEVNISVAGEELIIGGLKRSEELYLKEYVVLFSHKSCSNGKIVEVGAFKIN